jgi:hypothetical protein
MLAQRKRTTVPEPETLRRHREMYENRLRHFRTTQGRTEKEVVDKSNDPRVFRKIAETVEVSESANSSAEK